MTRFRSINSRVTRIAAAKVPEVLVPSVLRVPFGQTIAEARAAFIAIYNPKPGFAVLTVPAKPSNAAEQAIYETRFKASQLKLVAEARSNRIAVVADQPAPQPSFPQGGTVAAPKGRNFTQWVRNT